MQRVPEQKTVMIIAGEPSGDLHGAALVRALKEKDPSLFICGIGSEMLKDAGARIIMDSSKMAVMGITDVVFRLPVILKGMAAAKGVLKHFKPDLLILIDYPGFNLKVAEYAKKRGIPVLYYISPKIWAWRQKRAKKIRAVVDHMALILPFEQAFYRRFDVPVTYVGNPLVDYTEVPVKREPETREDVRIVGLLPGSRNGEVSRLLPVMLKAAHILAGENGNWKFIISQARSVPYEKLSRIVEDCPGDAVFEIETGPVNRVFQRADFIVAASGTVTLEAAIHGTPMIIVYKMSGLSYHIGKLLIKVNHVGLASLIAGKEVAPELLQDDANPETVAEKISESMNNPETLRQMREDLLEVRKMLGKPGVAGRTADIALDMLANKDICERKPLKQ